MIRNTLFRILFGFLFLLFCGAVWLAYGLYAPVSLPGLSGKVETGNLQIEGRSRRFDYYRPATLKPGLPLILMLHGSRSSGEHFRRLWRYRFEELADRHGFITLYPDGVGGHWNDCRKNVSDQAHQENVADTRFLLALLDEFVENHDIDPDRIFVVGFSNGGHMVYRLGLEAGSRFEALGVVSANFPEPSNQNCVLEPVRSRVPRLLIMNGDADPVNPFGGGKVTLFGQDKGAVLSSEASASFWAERLGSPPEQESVRDTQWGRYRFYSDGRVRLLRVKGGGHSLPCGYPYLPAFLIGPTVSDFSAADELVNFFLSAPSGHLPE